MKKENKNLIGKVFNKLTVLDRVNWFSKTGRKEKRWLCECSCENKTKITVNTYDLINGETKSCGCYKIDIMRKRVPELIKKRIKYTPKEASAIDYFKRRYSDGNLLFKDFLELSQQNCFYCNAIPNNHYRLVTKTSSQYYKDNCEFTYNGLDRIDPEQPHNINNVVPCCYQCNWAKSNLKLEDFIEWIKRLCDNF